VAQLEEEDREQPTRDHPECEARQHREGDGVHGRSGGWGAPGGWREEGSQARRGVLTAAHLEVPGARRQALGCGADTGSMAERSEDVAAMLRDLEEEERAISPQASFARADRFLP
jgi:hypothetical protein